MKLLKDWWRIKSASIPYNEYEPDLYSKDFQDKVKNIINWKEGIVNESFFPKIWRDLKTSLARQPLRPIISTHQWIPWNFFPFKITGEVDKIIKCKYLWEHYEAILEPRYINSVSTSQENEFIDAMYNWNLWEAFSIIKWIDNNDRSSTKWRTPFFICRPSYTDNMVQLPDNIVPKIEKNVNSILDDILSCSTYIKECFKKGYAINKDEIIKYFLDKKENWYDIDNNLKDSISYFQADTFINLKNEVSVENLQMPDVWFFLKDFSDKWSLKDIKDINWNLRKTVIDKILSFWFDKVILVTRPEVINNKEDLLEIKEINILKEDLEENIEVDITSINDINFEKESLYLLLNIDYSNIDKWIENIFNLAIKHPSNFSPNPFVQYVSKYVTWFNKKIIFWEEEINKLWYTTNPNHRKTNINSLNRIENYFNWLWLNWDRRILNINRASDNTTLYVSRDSIYSLRKISNFVKWEKYIEIIEVPFVDWEQIISKRWNDLLHMFRFMFVK